MKLSVVAGRASTGKRPPKPVPDHVREQVVDMLLAIGAVESIMGTRGLRWSDIAAAFAPQQPLPGLEPSPSPPAPEPPATSRERWIEPAKLVAIIEMIEKAAPPMLGDRSRDFLAGLRKLAGEFPMVRLSRKQTSWLDALAKDAGVAIE